jgi:hypothetical protein
MQEYDARGSYSNKYNMDGTPLHAPERGTLIGHIHLGSLGDNVYGQLTDHGCPHPAARERLVHGTMTKKGKNALLEFRVEVPGNELCDLLYRLTCDRPAKDLSGQYTGTWQPVEKVIDMKVKEQVEGGAEGKCICCGNKMHPAEDYFIAQLTKLVPFKHIEPQFAEITLKKKGQK